VTPSAPIAQQLLAQSPSDAQYDAQSHGVSSNATHPSPGQQLGNVEPHGRSRSRHVGAAGFGTHMELVPVATHWYASPQSRSLKHLKVHSEYSGSAKHSPESHSFAAVQRLSNARSDRTPELLHPSAHQHAISSVGRRTARR
jgi:hypothetical protein